MLWLRRLWVMFGWGTELVFGWFFSRDVMRAMPRPWAQRGGSPFCAVIGRASLPPVPKCLKSAVKDGWG